MNKDDQTPILCECGHKRTAHCRGVMGDVLLADGHFMCGMADCNCRDFKARHDEGYAVPIDLLLFCPKCFEQHVDEADPSICQDCGDTLEFHGKNRDVGVLCDVFNPWLNPSHKSHRCGFCNHVWRPADVPTNGVETLNSKGERDVPEVAETPDVCQDCGCEKQMHIFGAGACNTPPCDCQTFVAPTIDRSENGPTTDEQPTGQDVPDSDLLEEAREFAIDWYGRDVYEARRPKEFINAIVFVMADFTNKRVAAARREIAQLRQENLELKKFEREIRRHHNEKCTCSTIL